MKVKRATTIAKASREREKNIRKALLTSNYKSLMSSQVRISEELEYVSNALSERHLEETILECMGRVERPSEDDIANCVLQNLRIQADRLGTLAETLVALSVQARADLRSLEPASAID
jgi:hypothetical protein